MKPETAGAPSRLCAPRQPDEGDPLGRAFSAAWGFWGRTSASWGAEQPSALPGPHRRRGARRLRNRQLPGPTAPPRPSPPRAALPRGAHLAREGPREEQLQRLPLQLHQAGVAVLTPDAAVRAGGGAAAAARAGGAGAEARRAAQGARRAGANARGGRARGACEGARGRSARAGGRGPRRAERRTRALGGGPAAGTRLLVRFPVPALWGEGRRWLGGRADFIYLRAERDPLVSGAPRSRAGLGAPYRLPRNLCATKGLAEHQRRAFGTAPSPAAKSASICLLNCP